MISLDGVREFIIENFLFGDRERFHPELSFLETGVIDSTGMLELVGFLEEHYKVQIEDEEFVPENLDSLQN
ncbi:MAG: acyl carrier protein, partial [Thermodesulfobacteriota bacterium]